ncbi:unnamed protein product [Alopecurus aequalis]
MAPRRRNHSGYRGVRARPSGTYSAEIRSGETRLSLGTFETAHEVVRAYDAAAWGLPAWAVPPLDELQRRPDARAGAGARAAAAPERAFWDAQRATRVTARVEKRARKAAVDVQLDEENPALQWDDDDPRWEDMWLTSEYTTSEDGDGDWD